ncbi:hypothetical protein HAX54_000984 [Datura stramonium]|uniref:Uncharacterized protein n=1 Tax=Datura stramonium TaxID=4076 RepID=A0ABS8T366_DATST|nr:hypothetical protein [Datura stramonium]
MVRPLMVKQRREAEWKKGKAVQSLLTQYVKQNQSLPLSLQYIGARGATRKDANYCRTSFTDNNYNAYIYGMIQLQLNLGGSAATPEEIAILDYRYSLNKHTQVDVLGGAGL